MKILAVLLSLGVAYTQQSISLVAPPPSPVRIINAQLTGGSGGTTYYYWIVVHYPIGTVLSNGYEISNAPNSLNGSNYITVIWEGQSGATTYDLLRTTTPQAPGSSCTCAIATALTSTSYVNNSNTLSGYTLNLVTTAKATATLDNQNYSTPTVVVDTSIRNTADLPSRDSGDLLFNDSGSIGNSSVVYNASTKNVTFPSNVLIGTTVPVNAPTHSLAVAGTATAPNIVRTVLEFGADATGTIAANSAFAAAVASFGTSGGVLRVPCGTYRLTNAGSELILLPKMVWLVGDGYCSELLVDPGVSTSVPVIRYQPQVGTIEEGETIANLWIHANSGSPGKNGIMLDSSFAPINRPVIYGVKINGLSSFPVLLFGVSTNPFSIANARIVNSTLTGTVGGIQLYYAGDSNEIYNNIIDGTGPALDVLLIDGSSQLSIHHNVTQSGAVIIRSGSRVRIHHNNFEFKDSTATDQNMVHLIGSAGSPFNAIWGADIADNYIAPSANAGAANGILFDYVNESSIHDNTISYTSGGTARGVVLTTHSYRNIIADTNVFNPGFSPTPATDVQDGGQFTKISKQDSTDQGVSNNFNFGLGPTPPTARLHLSDATNGITVALIENSSGASTTTFKLQTGDGYHTFGTTMNAPVIGVANNTEVIRLNTDGTLQVGGGNTVLYTCAGGSLDGIVVSKASVCTGGGGTITSTKVKVP